MEMLPEGTWKVLDDGRWVCYRPEGTIRTQPFELTDLLVVDSELELAVTDQKINVIASNSTFGGKFSNIQFSNCTFKLVNFYSELENVQFLNCTFEGGSFTPHVKEGDEETLDLSTCVFEGCTVEVRLNQATTFAGSPDLGAWLDY